MEDNKKKQTDKISIKEIIIYFVSIFLLAFCITHFVGQRTVVDGSSMNETLQDKDNIILDKISYRFSDPERFDVIVFPYQYEDDTYFIKRIIGLPGETVYIDDEGAIYIDGEVLEESYGKEVIEDPGDASEPITLGDDEYFVLGDNRNNSMDSRDPSVGVIKRSDIVGKAWLRIYPFADFGFIDDINVNAQLNQ